MSTLKQNMELGKRAIKYVNKLGITSINVPFRITSYHGSPLSRFDMFLFLYMRSESNLSDDILDRHYRSLKLDMVKQTGQKLTPNEKTELRQGIRQVVEHNKSVRSAINDILHSHASKTQKKKQLTDLMNQVRFDANQFELLWHKTRTAHGDEARIRSARRAIKYKHGNCGEKSAIAATWLIENTKNTKKIFWVSAKNWDHAWAVMGEKGKLDLATVQSGSLRNWDRDTVVVDGWTGDWYPLHHHLDPIKGTFANPFQMYVRGKVQEAIGALNVMEEVEWPPRFSPTFTLDKAGKPVSEYQSSPQKAKVLDLVDDSTAVSQNLED